MCLLISAPTSCPCLPRGLYDQNVWYLWIHSRTELTICPWALRLSSGAQTRMETVFIRSCLGHLRVRALLLPRDLLYRCTSRRLRCHGQSSLWVKGTKPPILRCLGADGFGYLGKFWQNVEDRVEEGPWLLDNSMGDHRVIRTWSVDLSLECGKPHVCWC